MTVVYVVASGDGEDYETHGVFSTEELAREFIGECSCEYYVEDEELDSPLKEGKIGRVYGVSIKIETGETAHLYYGMHRCRETLISHANPRKTEVRWPGHYHHVGHANWIPTLSVVSYVSNEHAKEVAIEKRQEWLRMNPGWKPGDMPKWLGPDDQNRT
jgi:hypothetical protein